MRIYIKKNIDAVVAIGGDDTLTVASKLVELGLKCVAVPKTIDNDLALTDNSPGFGSVAKYVAVSIREASFDVASMSRTSTKVFILEVMGRHAGWIAAKPWIWGHGR